MILLYIIVVISAFVSDFKFSFVLTKETLLSFYLHCFFGISFLVIYCLLSKLISFIQTYISDDHKKYPLLLSI